MHVLTRHNRLLLGSRHSSFELQGWWGLYNRHLVFGGHFERRSLLRMKLRRTQQETKSPSVPQSAAINSASDGLFDSDKQADHW